MAAVRHLGFVLRTFGPPTKSIRLSLLLGKIWLESVQYFRQYASFTSLHVKFENAYSCP